MPDYPAPDLESGGLLRRLYATLGVLLVAVALISLPSGAKEELSALLRSSVLRPFIGLNQLIVTTRVRTLEVDRLRVVQDSLVARLTAGRHLAEENRRLRALLELSERAGPEWRPAEALRPSARGSESTFLLAVGVRDGIRERAPVLTREGLAGVVRELRSGRAVAMDWTHPEFRASAMSEDGLTYGLVEARQGDFREEDRLVLQGTPFNTLLAPGTAILTSGLGGTFPRGIPIGRVRSVLEAEGGWRRSYWVDPFVEPGSLTLVLVGTAGSSGVDMTGVWPERDRVPADERGEVTVLPKDSLSALQDSIAALRARVEAFGGGR